MGVIQTIVHYTVSKTLRAWQMFVWVCHWSLDSDNHDKSVSQAETALKIGHGSSGCLSCYVQNTTSSQQ